MLQTPFDSASEEACISTMQGEDSEYDIMLKWLLGIVE